MGNIVSLRHLPHKKRCCNIPPPCAVRAVKQPKTSGAAGFSEKAEEGSFRIAEAVNGHPYERKNLQPHPPPVRAGNRPDGHRRRRRGQRRAAAGCWRWDDARRRRMLRKRAPLGTRWN